MGIIDFVKGGVKELAIARPDEAKGDIVYKHPDQTIPMKAQLTVDSDELALFFKDGVFVGQFGPGRHTLDASNIPFLGQLIDRFTGGNVFLAEVFFVNTREMTDVKFGGQIGKVRDVQSGLLVQMMVHGTFSARVLDPPKLVIGLVGLQKHQGNLFLQWFRDQVLKVIKDDIAELCVIKKWPLPDVVSGAYTEEIEQEALGGLRKHVEPYGLEVVRFGNFHIAMGEQDEERLNKFYERASYVNMAGGLAGYQQLAQAELMMGAGEGMAKGGGGGDGGAGLAGAGLGLGLGMAAQMMGNMQGARAPGAATPQTPPTTHGKVTCGECNATVAPGKFCAECGKPLAAAGPKFCSSCGVPLAGKFCAECGTPAPA
ncbi:MAG TPA: SPFH domain-containing protein [Kofleriaceae bacterium]|nr:SPFH domain-containing protein [Kofleriaceae bacterium]